MSERWVTQDRFYDKERGLHGNCMQAAVASLLGRPMSDVPNFIEGPEGESGFWEEVYAFCRGQGLAFETYHNDGRGRHVREGYHLAYGPAARGCGHVVVMNNDEMAHDPHPSRAGLLEVQGIYVIRPLDLAGWTRST